MRRFLDVVAVLAVLAAGGCASALPLAGAAGAGAGVCAGTGWLTAAETGVKDGNQVLSADAPLKKIACDVQPIKPRGPVSQAFVDTYCANIPETVIGAGLTWAKVLEAMAAAERAQEAAP